MSLQRRKDWYAPKSTTRLAFMLVPNDEVRTVKYDIAHTN